ncbi:MAG: hypothetical protein KA981_07520 [Bacteroidia bacterium]|nr:hypothetical protein [Bacteroidia bacterium]
MYKFFFILICLFLGCVKEPPCTNDGKPNVSNVKEEDRAKIPYHSFAELTFIDSVTLDTHVFYGQGWKQNYWHYFNQDQNPHCYYGTNCELYKQTFTSSSYPDKLEIGIDLIRPGHPYLIISLNYRSYKTSPVNIGFPYTYDSLIINNRIYRNVNEINNNFQNSNAIKKYLTFFNVSHGILKIQLNETTLELISYKNP